MSDREPVNIMGVFAFPNPDKDKRAIRFIDSEYHTLFTIKDGESIVITRFDGEKMILSCTYIDDYHVCVGNSTYHICEFAEMQERNGNTYVPRTPKISDEIGTYEIYQIPATAPSAWTGVPSSALRWTRCPAVCTRYWTRRSWHWTMWTGWSAIRPTAASSTTV